MNPVIIGVAGTLMGVLLGGALQQLQASRSQRWKREDALADIKRTVFAEYLRSISGSYAQAMAGQRTRSEDADLHAATAQIEVLCDAAVFEPVRSLTAEIIDVHSRIAAGSGVNQAEIDAVDGRRRRLIDIFKADVARRSPDKSS